MPLLCGDKCRRAFKQDFEEAYTSLGGGEKKHNTSFFFFLFFNEDMLLKIGKSNIKNV